MLGRPLQAFSQLAAQIGQAIVLHLQKQGHRHIPIEVCGAKITPQTQASDALHIDLPRPVVLAHMEARYGFQGSQPQMEGNAPVSTTEKRIQAALIEAVRAAVMSALPLSTHQPHHVQCWKWEGYVRIGGAEPSLLSIAMDKATSHQVNACIAQTSQPVAPKNATAAPLAPLPIQLVAQLAEKSITAADVQALQPGTVLPITLERTVVLLNNAPMLSASVAEHQGKLHLTAFETLE